MVWDASDTRQVRGRRELRAEGSRTDLVSHVSFTILKIPQGKQAHTFWGTELPIPTYLPTYLGLHCTEMGHGSTEEEARRPGKHKMSEMLDWARGLERMRDDRIRPFPCVRILTQTTIGFHTRHD